MVDLEFIDGVLTPLLQQTNQNSWLHKCIIKFMLEQQSSDHDLIVCKILIDK